MYAKLKAAEDEAKCAKEMPPHYAEEKRVERQVEDPGKPTPDVGKSELSKAEAGNPTKKAAKTAAPRRSTTTSRRSTSARSESAGRRGAPATVFPRFPPRRTGNRQMTQMIAQ